MPANIKRLPAESPGNRARAPLLYGGRAPGTIRGSRPGASPAQQERVNVMSDDDMDLLEEVTAIQSRILELMERHPATIIGKCDVWLALETASRGLDAIEKAEPVPKGETK